MKVLRIFVFLLLATISCIAIAGDDSQKSVKDLAAAGWSISKPLSLSTVERQAPEAVRDGSPRVPQVPFGFANADWVAFKTKLMPGDTIVRMIAPSAFWANSAGWDGYAIVRSGVVVATFTILVS